MLNKHRVAATFRRYPSLSRLIVHLYRFTRPRYTVGASGVLLNAEGRILLVKHVFHPINPWGLPGGWVDRLENPSDTVCREMREELGLEVSVSRPLFVQKGQFWGTHLDLAFLVHCTRVEHIQLSAELTDYGWFALDGVPPLNDFHGAVVAAVRDDLHNTTRGPVKL